MTQRPPSLPPGGCTSTIPSTTRPGFAAGAVALMRRTAAAAAASNEQRRQDESGAHRLSYTGVGSRKTPDATLREMVAIAADLAEQGFELRSGAAEGADTAFETGCDQAGGRKAIFLPWPGYQGRQTDRCTNTRVDPKAFDIAARLHPAWQSLSRGPRSLHARNVLQVTGASLNDPSDFLICYTPDAAQALEDLTRATGGTATAIRLACLRDVPVINMARDGWRERLGECVAQALERQAGSEQETAAMRPVAA